MADISFNIARKELKIAQIAQLYQLFRLLHLIHIYRHGFYELSRMLMRKKVNNDVSKDSPIQYQFNGLLFIGNHLINMFWLSEKQDSFLKLVNNFMVELYSIVSIIRAVVI